MSFADLIAKKSSIGAEEEYSVPEAGLALRQGTSLEAFIQRHGHVTEEYKFYNDEVTLRFNTEDHEYFRVAELGNLILVNGVTNTVGIIDKSLMLTPWAAKMAIQKLLRIMPTEMVEGIIRIKPLTFDEFTTIALEAKSAHKDKLDEASDIGHMAHKCLEESIKHAMVHDPQRIVRQLINEPQDEQAKTAANSALVCMHNHNIRWIETETKIYSREYDYAGTMDGLALCDSCSDKACCPVPFKDRICLIDWKSSNYLKIEYLFQTASYKHAKMEERPELKIEDIFLFRLGKSEEEAGKFEVWHMTPEEYEEDFEGFLCCLNLTRLVHSVEERMKAQKATIRAVKKEQRETAKAIAKEQEKLQKAIAKAEAKKKKEEEKVRIKAEAKAERERLKAEKKAGRNSQVEVNQTVNLASQADIAGSIPAAPTIRPEVMTVFEKVVEQNAELLKKLTDSGSSGEGQGLISPSAPDKSGQAGSTPATTTISDDDCFAYTPNLEQEVLSKTTPEQREAFFNALDKVDNQKVMEAACTYISKRNETNSGLSDSTPLLVEPTSMGQVSVENSSENQTTSVPEMPQQESTTLTVETEEEFVPRFVLPME